MAVLGSMIVLRTGPALKANALTLVVLAGPRAVPMPNVVSQSTALFVYVLLERRESRLCPVRVQHSAQLTKSAAPINPAVKMVCAGTLVFKRSLAASTRSAEPLNVELVALAHQVFTATP